MEKQKLRVSDVFDLAQYNQSKWFKASYGQSKKTINNNFSRDVIAYGYGWKTGIIIFKDGLNSLRALCFGAAFPSTDGGHGMKFIPVFSAVETIEKTKCFAKTYVDHKGLLDSFLGTLIFADTEYIVYKTSKGYGFSNRVGVRIGIEYVARAYIRSVNKGIKPKMENIPEQLIWKIERLAGAVALQDGS